MLEEDPNNVGDKQRRTGAGTDTGSWTPPQAHQPGGAGFERRLLAAERAVATALAESSDVFEAACHFVRAVCEQLGWTCGTSWIETSPGGTVECVGIWGAGNAGVDAFLSATRALRWAATPPSPAHASWVEATPIYLSGVGIGADPRASLATAAELRSAFAFPVTAGGRVIGAVELFGREIQEPDGHLRDCARFIGGQLGAVCRRVQDHARLLAEVGQFTGTIEHAAIGIAHVAPGGRFIHVNRWFCDLLGYTRDELLGLTVKQVSHPDDRNVTDDVRARMRSGEIPFFQMEKRYLRKDGIPVWVALRISLQRDAAGQPMHDIATFQDISARKQAELALAARERSMRLVLDNTGDGLVWAGLDGIVHGEVSRAAREWLGTPMPGRGLADYLFPNSRDEAAGFACGFDQIAEDVLPFEISAAQMPARKQLGERVLTLEYKQIREEESFVGVLVILHDITMQIEAERRGAEAREVQLMVGQILRSPQGFRAFVDECSRLLQIIRDGRDAVVVKRALHTVKGNCAIFGVESMATLCHAIEGRLDTSGVLSAADSELLQATWRRALERVGEYSDSDDARIELHPEDLDTLKELLHVRADHGAILDVVHTWSAEPFSDILERLSAQAKRIAADLGKEVEVTVEPGPGRTVPEMSPFWSSLVHVIRNSIDHGIELPGEREAKRKPRVGRLRLTVRRGPGRAVEIQVSDDGAGIDLGKIEERARRLGLPFSNERELLQAVFLDGVTTRQAVTELSGRGVGLGAVRAACDALGGEAEVRSSAAGTTFSFSFGTVEP